jgi:hypothetical protein
MNNYDLQILSWTEFEDLTRDLLQSEFGIFIESFTTGKDSGIDLRFALTSDKKSIVQCKSFNNFSDLHSQLKKEKTKLFDKYIDRYYISTTVGLTPNRKNKIYQLFYPYIKDEADIFGKDDIINLISKHQEIEKKYYKLWLTSTNVLQILLNARIYNSSKFKIEQIKEDAKIYVQNESYNNAYDILVKNHYVIISGIPGIGKTTLAKILVYNLITDGINDLIYLSSNIGEAYKSYQESTKQVFLFDDFLGKNFLEDKLFRNEDQQLLDFIKKISKTKNKYFIMTTREYILKQAQQKYELLNRNDIEIAKCIVDLEQYTLLVRGEILYKHLYFSNMPKIFLQELVKNKRYLNIIKHKNYNPRIIETIIDREEWLSIHPDKYYTVFSSYFDNPESVWKYAFEQQISPIARIIVIILGSIEGLVELEILENATKSYYLSDIVSYIGDFNFDFEKALKEITGSFIKIEKDGKNVDAVEFYNPSISDFVHSYFLNNMNILESIIKKCICMDQLITIYQIFRGNIPDKMKSMCEREMMDHFDKLCIIKLKRATIFSTERKLWWIKDNSKISKLHYVSTYMFPLLNDDLLENLKNLFYTEWDNINTDSSYEEAINIYLSFYEHTNIKHFEQFIKKLLEECDSFEKLIDMKRLEFIDEEKFKKIIKSEESIEKINEIADIEYQSSTEVTYEYTKDSMFDVSEKFDIDLSYYINNIDERIEYKKNEEKIVEVHKGYKSIDSNQDEFNKIDELFNTLLQK